MFYETLQHLQVNNCARISLLRRHWQKSFPKNFAKLARVALIQTTCKRPLPMLACNPARLFSHGVIIINRLVNLNIHQKAVSPSKGKICNIPVKYI